jgi:LPPG:FO 2-phospho-L-lactate transferase
MLVVLTGGTGGGKLVHGLSEEANPEDLTVICNTADDFVLHGLHISPDIDTIVYTLAGIGDTAKGWGIKEDTFVALEWLGKYGRETWFRLGDRDLAMHLTRTLLLSQGLSLSKITEQQRKLLGVRAAVLPMTDDQVETRMVTAEGEISFQEYFVKKRWAVEVNEIFFSGAEKAAPAPGVIECIRGASAIVVCPSNPVTSIGPILAVPGIRNALREVEAPILAVSPIIGGAALSGPAHKLMSAIGMEPSAHGVAQAYADFIDLMIIAEDDRALKARIEGMSIRAATTDIRMESLLDERRLAREVLALI